MFQLSHVYNRFLMSTLHHVLCQIMGQKELVQLISSPILSLAHNADYPQPTIKAAPAKVTDDNLAAYTWDSLYLTCSLGHFEQINIYIDWMHPYSQDPRVILTFF